MRIAIVTDFLNQLGGAELVTHEIAELFPKADIYTLMANEAVLKKYFSGRNVIQHPKFEKSKIRSKYYRKFVPFYPTYIEDFDLRKYDLIISSSYLCAKGILCQPDSIHISYVHTPMRQAWTKYHDYLHNENDIGRFTRPLLRYIMNYIRIWDVISANRVDYFIANSSPVKQRIEKIYRREAHVIHPPVKVIHNDNNYLNKKEDYYITVGRLVPYKNIDLLIKTFNQFSNRKLLIVGDGNDRARLEKLAASQNISFMGYVKEDEKNKLVSEAKAFLFAAEEDFGISPVESMALGTPVIAYNKGGAQDYVKENINGFFFDRQKTESLKQAITKFENKQLDRKKIIDSVAKFDEKKFRKKFMAFVNECLKDNNLKG